MLLRWSKRPVRLVTGLSKSQENMILGLKHSLLIPMVTLGPWCLRRKSQLADKDFC